MKTDLLTVTGMTCGGCVHSLTRALKAVNGVHEVQVTLASEKQPFNMMSRQSHWNR